MGFYRAREKRTLAHNTEKGGLNDSNPNIDHPQAIRSQQASKEMAHSQGKATTPA